MHPELWARVSDLFERALDIEPEQRDAWIKTESRGDGEIEAAVLKLLRADESVQSGEFLEVSIPASDPDLLADALTQPDLYAEGTRAFGPYRLLRLIGQGGMGEVHLAERADGVFEQRVALKLLPHPTPGMVQRFSQERQILARLEHPNIARLLDGGIGEHGIPYFAMEYIEGTPISEFVRERQLDVATTLRLFLNVCDAVQYAHRNLIVHRDLKPSNILRDRRRDTETARFRHRKIAAHDRRHRQITNSHARVHSRLCGAGADSRRTGNDGDGCVFARRGALRIADREQTVRSESGRHTRTSDRESRCCAAECDGAHANRSATTASVARRCRPYRAYDARQRAGAPLWIGRRIVERHSELFERHADCRARRQHGIPRAQVRAPQSRRCRGCRYRVRCIGRRDSCQPVAGTARESADATRRNGERFFGQRVQRRQSRRKQR